MTTVIHGKSTSAPCDSNFARCPVGLVRAELCGLPWWECIHHFDGTRQYLRRVAAGILEFIGDHVDSRGVGINRVAADGCRQFNAVASERYGRAQFRICVLVAFQSEMVVSAKRDGRG